MTNFDIDNIDIDFCLIFRTLTGLIPPMRLGVGQLKQTIVANAFSRVPKFTWEETAPSADAPFCQLERKQDCNNLYSVSFKEWLIRDKFAEWVRLNRLILGILSRFKFWSSNWPRISLKIATPTETIVRDEIIYWEVIFANLLGISFCNHFAIKMSIITP